MFFFSLLSVLILCLSSVSAKYVFAHVVVGDTSHHNQTVWATDISLAQACGIDAFVLNVAYPDSNIPIQVGYAFAAAEAAGSKFKLLFSFDYLGGGQVWPPTGAYPGSVVGYLQEWANSSAYFKYNGKPFVSTFEGVKNINDWAPGGAIRSQVEALYFAPSWTSLSPDGIGGSLNNIEGFFSWDMWPNGPVNKTDDQDKNWQSKLPGKGYMMGVAPWFFHSADGGKDWVWRGDDLWADRWAQTLDVQPDFVQIVSWNDFAEAHYIGPIHDTSEIAAGSAKYVINYPHESFRDFIPYYIAAYKDTLSGFPLTRDQMQYWYRLAPATSSSTCNVVGNNADQSQTEYPPSTILEDGVFFSAILKADGQVGVKIGTSDEVLFNGTKGSNHWSLPFAGRRGVPVFRVTRNGVTTGSGSGQAIVDAAPVGDAEEQGCNNYNVWAGSF